MSGRTHVAIFVMALPVLWLILRMVRRRQLRAKYSVLWLSLGLVILVLAVAPGLLATVADWFDVFYAPSLLFMAGLGFLLLIVLHFSWELSRLEDRTRTLAEDNAILREMLVEGRAEARGPDGTGPRDATPPPEPLPPAPPTGA